MSLRVSLRLPREHGAWAMLYVPMLLGILVAERFPPAVWLLIISASFLFIARESLLGWWRARCRGRQEPGLGRLPGAYLMLSFFFGAPLFGLGFFGLAPPCPGARSASGLPPLFGLGFFGLAPLALLVLLLLVINIAQATRKEERTIVGEVLAIIGLTATAPAAYYVASGAWNNTALWIWGFSVLYFTSSVFYVKSRVLAMHPRREFVGRNMRRNCALYHSFLLGALMILALTRSMNLFVFVAFAPVLVRAAWSLHRPTHRLNLRRVGLLEFLYSLVFLVFMSLGFNHS